MDTRTRCFLEDELQKLYDDSKVTRKIYNAYMELSNTDWQSEKANELHDKWLESYSKYAYLYGLIERMGYRIEYPRNRFKISK